MHLQRDLHPTVLSSLEGIVDQIVWFRENWYEEVLRQLKAGLAKCHAISFDNRATVSDATITPHMVNFVKKLVSTFGIGVENVQHSVAAAAAAASVSGILCIFLPNSFLIYLYLCTFYSNSNTLFIYIVFYLCLYPPDL